MMQSRAIRANDHQSALVMRVRRGSASGASGVAMMADATPDAASRSAGAETGIGGRIEQIGEETPERHHDSADDDAPGDEIVIAGRDGVRGDVTHAWPTENLLDEERAADERRQRQADEGDDRQERVPQGMLPHDGALAEPLGAGGAHEVLRQDVEERGTLVASDPGSGEESQRERRQHEVCGDVAEAPA